MKIVFFGTPSYVVPILDALKRKLVKKVGESPIVAVVTQKPKPVGRKKFIAYSPVDDWAHQRGIPKFYCAGQLIQEGINPDLGILAAYGEIIPKEVIDLFPFGILNIHPSLLPKFRGASPLQAAIMTGDAETGATIIKIDEKMDHGDIVTQFKEEILPSDNRQTLGRRIFARSKDVLTGLIPAYMEGKIKFKKQEHDKATFTTLLKKEHGFIPPKYLEKAIMGKGKKEKWQIGFIKDFSLNPNPETVERFIRAMYPWPGAWTYVFLTKNDKDQKRLKIIKAHLQKSLVIDLVQLEGKDKVSWEEFKRGYPDFSLKES